MEEEAQGRQTNNNNKLSSSSTHYQVLEKTQLWKKHILNSPSSNHLEPTTRTTSTTQPSSTILLSSWEEKAFAEDTCGSIWPPRSYSCNFCMRQFRSAQALGGHMNVHRRDRARLQHNNQSSSANQNSKPINTTYHKNNIIIPVSVSVSVPVPVPVQANIMKIFSKQPCSSRKRTKVINSSNISSSVSLITCKKTGSATSTEDLDLELRLGGCN